MNGHCKCQNLTQFDSLRTKILCRKVCLAHRSHTGARGMILSYDVTKKNTFVACCKRDFLKSDAVKKMLL